MGNSELYTTSMSFAILTFIYCVRFLTSYPVEITFVTKLTEASNSSSTSIDFSFLVEGDFCVKWRR